VLLAHVVPDNVVIGEISPASADLGSLAKGHGVEIAKDFV
jgi:hypothetical protein